MIKQYGLKKQTAPIAIGVKSKQSRKDKTDTFSIIASLRRSRSTQK